MDPEKKHKERIEEWLRAAALGDLRALKAMGKPSDSGALDRATDAKGRTALIRAVIGGKIGAAEWLAGREWDSKLKDQEGWSALAQVASSASVSEKLVKRVVDRTWQEAPELIDETLRNGALGGMTPLAIAAQVGNADVVEALIKKGAKVESADQRGDRPLHHAARYGAVEVARLLLGAGAMPDEINGQEQTPLMGACSSGKPELVRLLLRAGADPHRKDLRGRGALWEACVGCWPKAGEIVRMLRDQGVDGWESIEGSWPIEWAAEARNQSALEALLESAQLNQLEKLRRARDRIKKGEAPRALPPGVSVLGGMERSLSPIESKLAILERQELEELAEQSRAGLRKQGRRSL